MFSGCQDAAAARLDQIVHGMQHLALVDVLPHGRRRPEHGKPGAEMGQDSNPCSISYVTGL